MRSALRRLAREPLLHFLLLGGGIFVAFSLAPRSDGGGAPGTIVVTQGQLASIQESFTRTRQRPPTPEEWQGLIQARVREEVYYREALALGLDKDDTIIRRRLQQKMEFLSDDVAGQVPPSDAELDAYLQAHPDTFRREERFTFRQVFLDPGKRGKDLAHDAAQLLARLARTSGSSDNTAPGDPILLGRDFVAAPVGEVERQFGAAFAQALAGLPPGRWVGPVDSAYGLHLVFVSDRIEGGLPALAEVRDAVRREWDESRRMEANEKFYQGLLGRYTVRIEEPVTAEASRPDADRVAAGQ